MPDPTIIRAQTLVQGNLTGEDPVEVEGQLIGQVALHNTLTVHPGGLVRGQLHVTQAVIFGRVEGTLTATERVYLGPSAVVIADVEAPLVRVDDGAKLHGKLLMELDAPASSPQAASEAQQPSGRGERAIIQPAPAVAPLALPATKPAAQQAPKNEPKPSFGSFTSPSRPATPQPATQPVTTQPVVTAPSFVSAKPQQTTPQATQPTAPAPQPTRTAVAVVEPEPTPEPVEVAAPVAVTPAVEPEIEAITPDPVAVIEPELAEETVVEEPGEEPQDEPHDAPDEDDAPAGGEDDAYAAEAAKYEHYTVKELREELRRLDLPVSGSKEDLIERLISAQ